MTEKYETSETIVRNLFSPFSCIQGSLKNKKLAYFVLNHLIKHHNTQSNKEIKL